MDYISFTQINMFLRCPKQYEFRYVNDIRSRPGGAALCGSGYHSGIEHNYKHKARAGYDISLDEVTDKTAEAVESKAQEQDYKFIDGETVASIKDQAVALVTEHHTIIAPKVQPLHVEHEIHVPLGDGMPYIKSFVDLIEQDGTIVDNKTSGKSYTQEDVDKDLQLTTYALARRYESQRIEPKLRFDVAVKTKKPKMQQIETQRTDAEMDWYLDSVTNVVRGIRAGAFPKNPTGWWCSKKWCGYWEICLGKAKK